jgi:hypothetical protein
MTKLNTEEAFVLQPSTVIQIGRLNFVVERFNLGVAQFRGQRTMMEDAYVVQ